MINRLKEHKKFFNISAIEEYCGIPKTVLTGYLLGRRKSIAQVHIDKINEFFLLFGDGFQVNKHTPQPPTESTKKHKIKQDTKQDKVSTLPDLNKDGSFNMDKWEVLSVKMSHKEKDLMVGYSRVGKSYFPK